MRAIIKFISAQGLNCKCGITMFLGSWKSKTQFYLLQANIWIWTSKLSLYIMDKTRMKLSHNGKCRRVTLICQPKPTLSSSLEPSCDLQMQPSFGVHQKKLLGKMVSNYVPLLNVSNNSLFCHLSRFFKPHSLLLPWTSM
jgi:hypothetical protein